MDYDPQNNKNKFVHLTNNCLVQKFKDSPFKKSQQRDKSADQLSESDEEENENIWSLDDFKAYLDKEKAEDNIFKEKIFPQIKDQVKASTLSV